MTAKPNAFLAPEDRIRTKRIYAAPEDDDGRRILVDRIWPRGMSKARARLDGWEKEIAPSDGLRKWFHKNAGHWEEFRERYKAELKERDAELVSLAAAAHSGTVTLVFASADEEHNNAVVLREVLLQREKR
jgi:uncharacterized protein YeaO (DUF488 family)